MDVIVNGRRSVIYKDKTYLQGQTIPGMEKREAERLIGKGHGVPAAQDGGVIAKTGPIDEMKVSELKALLDKLGVDYPADAKKVDLVELVEKSTGEPPAE